MVLKFEHHDLFLMTMIPLKTAKKNSKYFKGLKFYKLEWSDIVGVNSSSVKYLLNANIS